MSTETPAPERRSWGGILAILGILGITVFTFGADLFVAESDEEEPRKLIIGASFPSAVDEREVPVSIGKGRQVLVLVFPASCAACVRELEARVEIAGEHETDVLAVAVGPGTAAGRGERPAAPVIADREGELADRLGAGEPPTSLIIGADGTVLARRPAIPTDDLAGLLQRARSLDEQDGR